MHKPVAFQKNRNVKKLFKKKKCCSGSLDFFFSKENANKWSLDQKYLEKFWNYFVVVGKKHITFHKTDSPWKFFGNIYYLIFIISVFFNKIMILFSSFCTWSLAIYRGSMEALPKFGPDFQTHDATHRCTQLELRKGVFT